MNKFKHILESCWLCLKYPFLYPRNRFTGRNRKNVLHRVLYKLNTESLQNISITGKLVNESKYYSDYANFTKYIIKLDKIDKTVTIVSPLETKVHNIKSLLWSDDRFEILGLNLVFAFSGNPVVQVMVKTKDKDDKTNYGFYYENEEMLISKWKYVCYKVVNWIDREILDRILFIPTWNELDAMPEGWRKAFGIQMCDEIKAQLKKEHHLYDYRITQIKEKFGGLCWYDAGSSKEILNIILKYEDISYRTCIVCGKPATKISGGWICPYCDDHFPEQGIIYKEKINDKWEIKNGNSISDSQYCPNS